METHNRKPKSKVLNLDKPAQIEFAAPHSLAECLYRLRDTKHLEAGFISPGIDPSFEKVDSITYKFRVRRTWYDTRYRSHHSSVEVRGYLRALDSGTTMVIGKIHVARSILIGLILMICILVVGVTMPDKKGSNLFIFVVVSVGIAIFFAILYSDRRTLITLLRTTLDGDV